MPLQLADGRIVYPGGKVVDPNAAAPVNMVEIPSNTEAREIVLNTRRKAAELPDVPRTMNGISVVLAYTLFGLDDTEIAIQVNVPVEQIARIKALDAYKSMYDTVINTVIAAESDSVRDLFAKHARAAAGVIVKAMSDESVGVQMAAAKDVLDRGGHRPADVLEHRHKVEGGFTIQYIHKDTRAPVIDVEVGE